MLDKIRKVEIKFYELIGIKQFRKAAFLLTKIISLPLRLIMSKDEWKEAISSPSNYNMKKGNGIDDLKDFKSMLALNSGLHIFSQILITNLFIDHFQNNNHFNLWLFVPAIINTYCLFLQHYNYIRIDNMIRKMKVRESKQKKNLRQDLIKQNPNVLKYLYTLEKNKTFLNDKINTKKEENLNFYDFIEKASLNDLRAYKEYLTYNTNTLDEFKDKEITIEKPKTKKITIKQNEKYQ